MLYSPCPSTQPTPKPPTFPPEIQSMFISELRGHNPTLLSASLVSRQWREESLAVYFQTLEVSAFQVEQAPAGVIVHPSITFTYQFSRLSMWSFVTKHVSHLFLRGPTAAEYAKAAANGLQITPPLLDICILSLYLRHYQKVQEVTLQHLIWEGFPSDYLSICCQEVLRPFTKITLQQIRHRRSSEGTIFQVLHTATSLTHLEYDLETALQRQGDLSPPGPPPLPRTMPISPTSLTVTAKETIWDSLHTLPGFPLNNSLTTLNLRGVAWRDVYWMCQAMKQNRESIRSLELTLSDYDEGVFINIYLLNHVLMQSLF